VIYYPSNDEKPRLLVGLLKHMDPRRSMVFVNTRRAAEEIERMLQSNGINAEAISGDVPQRKRLRMLTDFHDGTLAVLIGTDVASRGLHIPDVSHVFNYDLPQDPEDYVHRIGRTARAGAEGDAISFGCEEYVMSLPDIEAYIDRKIPVAAVPAEMLPDIAMPERRPRHPPRGRPGQGSSHGRSGGGGGRNNGNSGARGGSSRGGPRHSGQSSQQQSRPAQQPRPPQQQQPGPTPAGNAQGGATSTDSANPERKRRRRRRRGGGSAPAGAGDTPTPASE
jgi:ATP-dependent RNA helicase RhlB